MKLKVGLAALLTGAMAAFGVGCSAQPSDTQGDWFGNFFLYLILMELCQGPAPTNCPLPGLPVPPTIAPAVQAQALAAGTPSNDVASSQAGPSSAGPSTGG